MDIYNLQEIIKHYGLNMWAAAQIIILIRMESLQIIHITCREVFCLNLDGCFQLHRFILQAKNQIFIAGGNINGGDGSYLIKLTGTSSSPFNITATQFNYDFKLHADGLSGISAI